MHSLLRGAARKEERATRERTRGAENIPELSPPRTVISSITPFFSYPSAESFYPLLGRLKC